MVLRPPGISEDDEPGDAPSADSSAEAHAAQADAHPLAAHDAPAEEADAPLEASGEPLRDEPLRDEPLRDEARDEGDAEPSVPRTDVIDLPPPRRASPLLLIPALVFGLAAGVGASPFGVGPAIMSALLAAAVAAGATLLWSSGHRLLGGGVFTLATLVTGCCAGSGAIGWMAQSAMGEIAALESVAAPDGEPYMRHPTLGFVVRGPHEGWEANTQIAAMMQLSLAFAREPEGTWAWIDPQTGDYVFVNAARSTPSFTPERAHQFLRGFVTGVLGSGGQLEEPMTVARQDDTLEIWLHGVGQNLGRPIAMSVRYLSYEDEGVRHELMMAALSGRSQDWTRELLSLHHRGEPWRGPGAAPAPFEGNSLSLALARAGTVLARSDQVLGEAMSEPPPDSGFALTRYETALGPMSAYVSLDAQAEGADEPTPRAGVLWLHAGYGTLSAAMLEGGPRALAASGVAVMVPSFRGEGENPGVFELLGGEVDDARRALVHFAALPGVDAERIYVVGDELGGSLALLMAELGAPARGFVSLSGWTDATLLLDAEVARTAFDWRLLDQSFVRSPIHFASQIQTPTTHVSFGSEPSLARVGLEGVRGSAPITTLSMPCETRSECVVRVARVLGEHISEGRAPLLVAGDLAGSAD